MESNLSTSLPLDGANVHGADAGAAAAAVAAMMRLRCCWAAGARRVRLIIASTPLFSHLSAKQTLYPARSQFPHKTRESRHLYPFTHRPVVLHTRQHLSSRSAQMANIKSLSDLNGEDGGGDDNGKFNDYYAGGEKRYVLVVG